MTYNQIPKAQGLYRPEFEHDACGIGLYAHLKGQATHEIVKKGLNMLCQLDHRGGQGGRRLHRRKSPPAGVRGHGHDPLPGKRRRQPRADGFEHAASGGSPAGAAGAHRGNRHRVQGGLRLGRGAPGQTGGRGGARLLRSDRHPR